MKQALRYALTVIVVILAVYGAVKLVSGLLTKQQGEKAAEAMHPFVSGMASVAEKKFRESLAATPDEQLQNNAELYIRKMYPAIKGGLRGFYDELSADPDKPELQRRAYETGRILSENVVKPFSRGVLDGSGPVLEEMNKRFGDVRNFIDKNKDTSEIVNEGLNLLQRALKNLPPPPIPPGLRQPGFQQQIPEYQR